MKTILNFKNQKVRVKILLSFAAAIAIMCIAVAFIALSSFKVMDNVDIIGEDVTIQRELSDLMACYEEADIKANVLYNGLNQNANEAFAKHASEAD